jgi:hypothetical protein
MGNRIITIERNALYKQVWNEPVSKLALKYSISDVGLKKICKKLKIPTPPRGYWAKVQNGVSEKRIPLPKLKSGEPDTYEIRVDDSEKPQPIFASEAMQLISRVESWREIKIPQKLVSPHPLVAETRDSFAQSNPDKYGRFRPWKKRYLDIRVTSKSINRALRIMDALIKKLEMLGFQIIVKEGYHSSTTKVKIFGEKISFFIFEKVLQIDHVLTEKEKKDLVKYPSISFAPKWDYQPTGLLKLEIDSWGSRGVQKRFSDRKTILVENQIKYFIISLIEMADLERQRTLERKEEERKRIEKLRKREELERQRREEEERLQDLENQARMWAKADQLRAYIDAVENDACKKGLTIEQNERLNTWLSWARKHADRIDPLENIVLT